MLLPRLSLEEPPLLSPALRDAFAAAPAMPLTEYRPAAGVPAGTVRAGWHGSFLCILADLERPEPETTATADGDPLWTLGDCFEIFLKRPDVPSYLELHVSPGGHILQLRFPQRRTKGDSQLKPRPLVQEFGVPEKRMRAEAAVRPDRSGWEVFAEIDLRELGLAAGELAGETFDASFCVCNFTRRPVIFQGSTSRLEVLDVHLHSQWGRLECAAD